MKFKTLLLCLAISPALLAENHGHKPNQGFLNAAKHYDQKAAQAAKNGNNENAQAFRKLASIKRQAAISKGSFDWSEYHKIKSNINRKQPQSNTKNQHHNKNKCQPSKPNQGYLDKAKKYDAKAAEASKSGAHHNSEIYKKLAAIKRQAAVSSGSFDWSEYRQLKKQLKTTPSTSKDHRDHKPVVSNKPKPKAQPKSDRKSKTQPNKTPAKPTNRIAEAQQHASLANAANKKNDDYAAQIHTRLSAILIDAAAKEANKEAFDWTEYKELKEMLHHHQQD